MIVVIGIIAAVSIVVFNGAINRAYDTTVRHDLSTTRKNLEIQKIMLGRYPHQHSEMPEIKVTKAAYDTAGSNIYFCINRATDVYAYSVRSKSKRGFMIMSDGSTQEHINVNETMTCQATGLADAYNPNRYTAVGYADDRFGGQWPTVYNPDFQFVQ